MSDRKINTLDEVIGLATDGTIYVRYSRGHEDDIARGYSLNHQTKAPEPGLSVQEIGPEDTTEFRGWIAMLVADYAGRIHADPDSYGWICRGDVAGRDADNCPAITNVEFIARLDRDLVMACLKFARAYKARRRDPGNTAPWPTTEEYGL